MNNLQKRIISAVVFFLFFVLAAIHSYLFGIVFSIFMILSLKELCDFAKQKKIKPNKLTYPLALTGFWLLFFILKNDLSAIFLIILPAFLLIILILDLRTKEKIWEKATFYSFSFFYVILPFGLLNFLVFREGKFDIYLFVLFFLTIWSNDIGAYFSGTLAGKNKIAPAISPKKTVEGTIGGIIMAISVSVIFYYITGKFSLGINIVLGIAIAISSFFGDLFESAIKRQLKIKDSGNIMPGHGGMLDRFDSMIFSIIFVILIFAFANNFKILL